MTFDEFKIFIKPLAVLLREVKDEPTWRLYHAALMKPPAPSRALLTRALPRAATNRKWFPTAAELRADAEAERTGILEAHPFTRCASCRDSGGWITITDALGVERVTRCSCFSTYSRELAALGVGSAPLALPAPVDVDG